MEYEFKVNIGGTDYGMDKLISVHITQPLFDKFDVGLACSAQLTLEYYFDIDPPRMASVIPFCREKNSSNSWIQLGVFYIDQRKTVKGKKTLTCFDSMVKADSQFITESGTGEWPRDMKTLANDIASFMGLDLDDRTLPMLHDDYYLDFPNEDTARTLLSYIASSHAGNWIITAQNKLLLIPLFSLLPRTMGYLVTEEGCPIVFGNSRILL